MHTDLSIDLETLGTRPGSVITQIGLCAFDLEGYGGMSSMLIKVDPQSCIDAGFTLDWSTIAWWMNQSDAARITMISCSDGHPIDEALDRLAVFCGEHMRVDFRVWGHGATFDVSLLDVAYAKMKRYAPWSYRGVRDLRTLAALAPENVYRPSPHVEHNAMDDATSQAEWARNMHHAIKGKPYPAAPVSCT